MLALDLDCKDSDTLNILCLGAHSDDIEIGALATILGLIRRYENANVTWAVFSAIGPRKDEAMASATHCTQGAGDAEIRTYEFEDGYFPQDIAAIKSEFEDLKKHRNPDLILTHYRHDLHQDHRAISDLTWQTFRNHLILEYEIPKYDGDLGVPNVFSPVSQELCEEKVQILDRFFGSQRSKSWFTDDLFTGLMRLRGMECQSPTRYAEAFYCRKAVIA